MDNDLVKKLGLDKVKGKGKNQGASAETPEATNKDLAKCGFKIIPKKGTRLWEHSL